jgi:hypothetical protein
VEVSCGAETQGDRDVVSVCGLHEHGAAEGAHPAREFEVCLADVGVLREVGDAGEAAVAGGLLAAAAVLLAAAVVGVLGDGLPVDDEAAAVGRGDEARDVGADELDDAMLEPRAHDGLLPLGWEHGGQDVRLAEVEELDADATLELRDGLGLGHMPLVVEGQDDGGAAELDEMPHNDGSEFGIKQVGPV